MYFFREGGRESVNVDLDGIPAFGFYEKLVAFSFGKSIDLVFDAGAVAGAHALDTTGVHGTAIESGLEDFMYGGVGIGYPAAFLLARFRGIEVGKANDFFVTFLFFHFTIVEASAVDAGRGTGLEPVAFKAERDELFGDASGCFFCYAAAAETFFTDMNDAV